MPLANGADTQPVGGMIGGVLFWGEERICYNVTVKKARDFILSISIYKYMCIYMILDFIAQEGERAKSNCHTATLSHIAAVLD